MLWLRISTICLIINCLNCQISKDSYLLQMLYWRNMQIINIGSTTNNEHYFTICFLRVSSWNIPISQNFQYRKQMQYQLEKYL